MRRNLKIFVSAILFLVLNLSTQNIVNAAEKPTDKAAHTSASQSEVPCWEDADESTTGTCTLFGQEMTIQEANTAMQEHWSQIAAQNDDDD